MNNNLRIYKVLKPFVELAILFDFICLNTLYLNHTNKLLYKKKVLFK